MSTSGQAKLTSASRSIPVRTLRRRKSKDGQRWRQSRFSWTSKPNKKKTCRSNVQVERLDPFIDSARVDLLLLTSSFAQRVRGVRGVRPNECKEHRIHSRINWDCLLSHCLQPCHSVHKITERIQQPQSLLRRFHIALLDVVCPPPRDCSAAGPSP